MKNIFAFMLICMSYSLHSQDLIVKKDSSKIYCDILKEDTSTIYFKATKDGKVVEQSINKSDVLSYFNGKAIVQSQIKTADSLAVVKETLKFKNDSLIFISKTKFKYLGKIYSAYGLEKMMNKGSEEQLKMKKAKNNLYGSLIFGTSGGIFLGSAIGYLMNNKQQYALQLGGIGVGLILLSLPFDYLYKKYAQSAVRLFNAKKKVTGITKQKLSLEIAPRGVGFCLKF